MGDSCSTPHTTTSPPDNPAAMAMKVSSGVIASMARKRGTTSAWKGSTPITRMASTSWFIRMAPISAAKEEAERPARMMQVTSTPNSRSTPMPTSSTA